MSSRRNKQTMVKPLNQGGDSVLQDITVTSANPFKQEPSKLDPTIGEEFCLKSD